MTVGTFHVTEPFLILGKTFPKKLLQKLFLDDVYEGSGCAYFGPSKNLLDKIPPERIKDTILFELDYNHPRSFNPLETVPEEDRSAIAEYVVEAFAAAYPSTIPTALLDNNLLAASLAMLSIPNGTLYASRHLFTSSDYRKDVVPQLADPDLKNLWELFDALEDREQRQQAQSILNRLMPLTSDPWYRNILAQTKSFRMTDKTILIVDLPSSRKGTTLAALIMARLQGRVYIESPHIFVGRGRPIIACSYLDQLPQKLRTELIGTADMLAFRLGVRDAEELTPEFNPRPQDYKLTELHPGRAYLKTHETVHFTLPKSEYETFPDSPQKIRNRSRSECSIPRAVIEKRISKFLEGV